MTKEELDKIIKDNKFSHLVTYSDESSAIEELDNLIKKVYYDGMAKGYEIAVDRLQLLESRLPPDYPAEYVEKNRDKIKNILSAIQEFES